MSTKISKLKTVCGFSSCFFFFWRSSFTVSFASFCCVRFQRFTYIFCVCLLSLQISSLLVIPSMYVIAYLLTFSCCAVRSEMKQYSTLNEWMNKWMCERRGCGGEKKPKPTTIENRITNGVENTDYEFFFAQYISVVGGVLTPYETPLHAKVGVCASVLSVARCRRLFGGIRMFGGHTALFAVCVRMMSFDCCSFFFFFYLNRHSNETEQNGNVNVSCASSVVVYSQLLSTR